MPLSTDPVKRARQLANLRAAPPPPPAGNSRALVHGGTSALLVRDVEDEVRALMDALGAAAPVRDPDGSLPAADVVAVEAAARALKRWRHLSQWCDAHGRIKERTGSVKPAAELEVKAEHQLHQALDRLGLNPSARSKLGLNLARAATLGDALAEGGEAWRRNAKRGQQTHGGETVDGEVVDDAVVEERAS